MPEDKSLDDIAAGLLFVDEVQKFLALIDAELAVDVAHVGAHGADGEHERLRDVGRGEATRQIHEHLGLAGRKAPGFGHLGTAGLQGVLHARLGELEGVAGRIGAGRKYTLVGGSRDCRRVLICRAIARGGPGVATPDNADSKPKADVPPRPLSTSPVHSPDKRFPASLSIPSLSRSIPRVYKD